MSDQKKVVNFDELRAYKQLENDIINNELYNFDEAYRKMREFYTTSPQEKMDLCMKKRIIELEKENKKMATKLKKSFPAHIIIYLTVCSFMIGISMTLLTLTYAFDVCLINPYYIICTLLISLTLFCTAAVAAKDWKEYLNGKQ